jgi:hypothetical protein
MSGSVHALKTTAPECGLRYKWPLSCLSVTVSAGGSEGFVNNWRSIPLLPTTTFALGSRCHRPAGVSPHPRSHSAVESTWRPRDQVLTLNWTQLGPRRAKNVCQAPCDPFICGRETQAALRDIEKTESDRAVLLCHSRFTFSNGF